MFILLAGTTKLMNKENTSDVIKLQFVKIFYIPFYIKIFPEKSFKVIWIEKPSSVLHNVLLCHKAEGQDLKDGGGMAGSVFLE